MSKLSPVRMRSVVQVDEPCTVVFIKVLYSYNCGHGILAVTFMSIKKKMDVVHALLSL
jgi:hypothetical protein